MGYLVIDDRAQAGGVREWDTVHCRHCEALILVTRYRREGAYCLKCGPVCQRPECSPERCGRGGSLHFMRRVGEQLRRDAFARAAGLAER